jgi:hypothetical protein
MKVAKLAVALGLVLSSTGCHRYHVYQIGGPQGRELGDAPSNEWKYQTVHSLVWGQVRQDIPVDNCQLGNGQRLGIDSVTIRSNLLYSLVTVGTLGFWSPLKVGWRCAKPPVQGGTLGESPQP